MNKPKRIVVALGGNAIIKEYERGTVPEQFANARSSLKDVPLLIQEGYELVITHGNGPQVGNILIRVERSIETAYELPLGVCVAETQGEMGYMIAQTLKNFFTQSRIDKEVVALLTQVIVDPDHPDTFTPSKPIGPFLDKTQLSSLEQRMVPYVDDSGRGYRRIVPSPIPLKVVESEVIKKLIDLGVLVVAAGGGGMPVYIDHRGCLEGVDAVVDKDLASAVLGLEIGADELIILTATEKVSLNYRTPNQINLDHLTAEEARKYGNEGHFPPGSMGPKIEAALHFLEAGGSRVIITSANKLLDACHGKAGTVMTLE
ncbi:MAG: carbamate kinase [Planctomycetota bacterium]